MALVLSWLLCQAGVVSAHPVPLASAAVTVEPAGQLRVELTCDVAAFVMQAEQGHLEGPLAEEFQSLPAEDLRAMAADARRTLVRGLRLTFDGQSAAPDTVELPDLAAIQRTFQPGAAAQAAVIQAAATVPRGASQFTVRFPTDIGPVTLKFLGYGDDRVEPVVQLLAAGQPSQPISLGSATEAAAATAYAAIALQFLGLGFEHILPYGLDHILFVLGLFLLSPQLKALLWQVTAFTVAHSISLALSSCGVISLSASVVEPLIALSIAFVALENVFTTQLQPWRPLVIFGFGLIHGLGFAEVLHETGLGGRNFVTALLAFNAGVELGQLAVIGLAFLAVGWFRQRAWYRPRIVVPASCCIALAGLYWTAERIWFS